MRNVFLFIFLAVMVVASFMSHIFKWEPTEKSVITIEKIEISKKDFNWELQKSRYGSLGDKGRQEFLDQLITRKLILLEAEKQGFDRDGTFLRDVQDFWQQRLLKTTLRKKNDEFKQNIQIVQSEVRDYFLAHRDTHFSDKTLEEVEDNIRFILRQEKLNEEVLKWIEGLKREANVSIDYEALGLNANN